MLPFIKIVNINNLHAIAKPHLSAYLRAHGIEPVTAKPGMKAQFRLLRDHIRQGKVLPVEVPLPVCADIGKKQCVNTTVVPNVATAATADMHPTSSFISSTLPSNSTVQGAAVSKTSSTPLMTFSTTKMRRILRRHVVVPSKQESCHHIADSPHDTLTIQDSTPLHHAVLTHQDAVANNSITANDTEAVVGQFDATDNTSVHIVNQLLSSTSFLPSSTIAVASPSPLKRFKHNTTALSLGATDSHTTKKDPPVWSLYVDFHIDTRATLHAPSLSSDSSSSMNRNVIMPNTSLRTVHRYVIHHDSFMHQVSFKRWLDTLPLLTCYDFVSLLQHQADMVAIDNPGNVKMHTEFDPSVIPIAWHHKPWMFASLFHHMTCAQQPQQQHERVHFGRWTCLPADVIPGTIMTQDISSPESSHHWTIRLCLP